MIVFIQALIHWRIYHSGVQVVKRVFNDIKEILSVGFTRKEETETSIVNEIWD